CLPCPGRAVLFVRVSSVDVGSERAGLIKSGPMDYGSLLVFVSVLLIFLWGPQSLKVAVNSPPQVAQNQVVHDNLELQGVPLPVLASYKDGMRTIVIVMEIQVCYPPWQKHFRSHCISSYLG